MRAALTFHGVSEDVVTLRWAGFGLVMVFGRDFPAGPPRRIAGFEVTRLSSSSRSRSSLTPLEEQTVISLPGWPYFYISQAVQDKGGSDASMQAHLAATSRVAEDCNCDLAYNEDLDDPQFYIQTRSNRAYQAWSLVLINYGWEPWRLREKRIKRLQELDFIRHLRELGLFF